MPLRVGSRVGHFEVTGLLGVGGMGQVYRAADTKLRRDVALKILPEEFATNPERLSRFEREAHALAALNHPGIATIHGIEEFDGTLALVLELVSGPTLEDLIARHPVPVAEALRLAMGIAAAVEAAHERGIVHRDLKPANIKVQEGGTVKVLDFGIAKALSGAGRQAQAGASDDPTLTATAEGVVLGTAAYMSPEQARGMPVDERTDVWAFGCILFEMLTGQPPFGRGRLTDILANVLKEEPDYSALPADMPPLARRVVRRCLEKDRRERLRHIGDARADLRDAVELRDSMISASASSAVAGVESEKRQRATTQRRALVAGALTATAALAGLAVWLVAPRVEPETSTSQRVRSFEIGDVASAAIVPVSPPSIAISPDGTRIVYPTREGMVMRSLLHSEQVQARGIGGGPDGWPYLGPFFSPDGESIGFSHADSKLVRVSVRGGAPSAIADLGSEARWLEASWGADDRIVFATSLGLYRVSAGGGEPELLISPDPDQQELYFFRPQILPGGLAVLFTVLPRDPKAAPRVAALDLDSLQVRAILNDGYGARYSPTGHLVYVARGRLQVVAFDVDTLRTRGEPQALLDTEIAGSSFQLGDNGTLVYQPSNAGGASVLVWVDRDGREEPLAAPAGGWARPRISPDGKRVAAERWVTEGRDIYIWDLERATLSRLTDDPGMDIRPQWSADGNRIFFSSTRTGPLNVYSRAADGGGSDERLFESDVTEVATGLTPDGSQLLVFHSAGDIVAIDLGQPHQIRTLLATKFAEGMPSVSPDGRWVAYQSDADGQMEVYVGPFPDLESGRRKISSGGGEEPLWSAKGDEIFFRGPRGRMMAVHVALTPTFTPGKVTELFSNPLTAEYVGPYDVSLDGRFLMQKEPSRTQSDRLVVVMNWFKELKAKVPGR